MQFSRVDGFVIPNSSGGLDLTVNLDNNRTIKSVRSEQVPVLDADLSLDWQADQYVQETIGTVLAEEGWEVVSEGDPVVDSLANLGRSRSYLVRLV